ncbi:hypothetical protein Tco_1194668 [Tanacetum coccineum]
MPPPHHHLVTTLLASFTSLSPPLSVNAVNKSIGIRLPRPGSGTYMASERISFEDAFSSTITPDYTPASLNYSPALSGNTSSDPSEDLSKDLLASLAISPFYDDPYMKVMQTYNATNNESPIPPPRASIAPPTVLPPSLVFETRESSYVTRLERHEEQIETILNHLDELPLERIEHMEDKIEDLGNGRREQIRLDDEIVLARVRIYTLEMAIEDIQVRHQADMKSLLDKIHIEHMIPPTPPRDIEPLVGSPISLSPSSSVGSSSPVRSTTLSPDYPFDESIFAEIDNSLWIIPRPLESEPVLEELNEPDASQAATMENTNNTNRNTGQGETSVARKCSYKEFMSCQPFNFKGTEGAICLIRWFEQTELVFLCSNCTEDCKVKFATGTLTEEDLSWWNSFAKPIGIKEAYKIPWSELKKLLIKNVQIPEKLKEVFIGRYPERLKNVTASKPQTLAEAITIT